VSLRNQIEQKTGTKPKLRIGGPGVLDVSVDGKVLWSKKKQGRMPTVDEIMALLPRSA
jgi:predicted Rdx family selenoprotein